MKAITQFSSFLESSFEGAYIVDKQRRIVFWNASAEVISGYLKTEVMGKACYDNILIHTDDGGNQLCLSGCPLLKSMQTNVPVNASVYLKHKNGHRVPVSVRTIPVIENGETIGAIEFFQVQHDKIDTMYGLDKLRVLALTDHLTGLPNRYYIENFLQSRINEYPVFSVNFGILFIDIDHFKQLNDLYGHEAGDIVLRNIAETLIQNTRDTDRFGRWGGEEFLGVCVCPDRTALLRIAEKTRMLIAKTHHQIEDADVQVTVSIGAAMYRDGETRDQFFMRADTLLYQSKNEGRNRVTIE